MTGPFVPVRILNPIRAVVGIPHHRFNLFVKCSRKFTNAIREAVARKSAIEGTLSLCPAPQRARPVIENAAKRGSIEEETLEGAAEIVARVRGPNLPPRFKGCVRVEAAVSQRFRFGREDHLPERGHEFIEIRERDLVDEVVLEHCNRNGRAPGEGFYEEPRPKLLGTQNLRYV